jgi:hypothetical protein
LPSYSAAQVALSGSVNVAEKRPAEFVETFSIQYQVLLPLGRKMMRICWALVRVVSAVVVLQLPVHSELGAVVHHGGGHAEPSDPVIVLPDACRGTRGREVSVRHVPRCRPRVDHTVVGIVLSGGGRTAER